MPNSNVSHIDNPNAVKVGGNIYTFTDPHPNPLEVVVNRILDKMKDREGNHGDPKAMLKSIAKLWSAWLTIRLGKKVKLNQHDAAVMLELFKIARTTNAYTEDGGDDKVGYALLEQVMRENEKNG